MTAQEINNESRLPVLRKAVRETGRDPAGMDVTQMRQHLLVHFKVAPPPAKPVAPKPPTKPAAAAPAAPVASAPQKPGPKKPAQQAINETGLPFGAAKEFWDTVSPAGQQFFNNIWTAIRAQELRISILEQKLSVAATGSDIPSPAQAVDEYAPIRRFINAKHEIEMSDKDVMEATEQQLDLILSSAEVSVPEGTAVREKRVMVANLFGVAPPADKPAGAKGGKAPASAPSFAVGDVVVVEYDGETYDPCQIISVKGKGKYGIFFDVDTGVVDDGTATVISKSANAMSNNWDDHKEDHGY